MIFAVEKPYRRLIEPHFSGHTHCTDFFGLSQTRCNVYTLVINLPPQSFAVSHEGLSSFSASGVCLPRSGDDGDAQQMLIPLSLVAPFLNPTHSQVGGECSQVGEGFRRRV